MVKSKNKKSVIALVVMAFLLVASICLAATGAWFTDVDSKSNPQMSFGKIDIAISEDFAVTWKNTIDTTNLLLMPGSELVFAGKINNIENEAWVAYKVEVVFTEDVKLTTGLPTGWVYTQASKTLSFETKAAKLEKTNGEINLATALAGVKIPETLGNTAAGATCDITLQVAAVQTANNSTITAESAFADILAQATASSNATLGA